MKLHSFFITEERLILGLGLRLNVLIMSGNLSLKSHDVLKLQSNFSNTYTEGTEQSVRIGKVSVL